MADQRGAGAVLVVGAGPVGLVVASELSALGIVVTIIERSPRAETHSRASVLWPRTLELLDRLGLASGLLRGANEIQNISFYEDGIERVAHDLSTLSDTPFPFAAMLPQPSLELLLEQHLRESGIRIQRDAELIGLRRGDADVAVEIAHGDGTVTCERYGWLVGADGSNSTVRRLSGIRFPGHRLPARFTLFDAFASGLPATKASYHFGAEGSLAIAPLTADYFRFATSSRPHSDAQPPLEHLRSLANRLGIEGSIDRVLHTASFRSEVRNATCYRSGQILLAGDAAHLSSPASGQGLNIGVHDAVDLGWRLGRTLLGQVSDTTLDTYAQERRSAVRAVLAATEAQTQAIDLRESSTPPPPLPPMSTRQLVQFDTSYGGGGKRFPPLPLRIRDRFPSATAVAPAVVMIPGHRFTPQSWNELVVRARRLSPSYFEIIDLARVALAPTYTGAVAETPVAVLVRPDQHVHATVAPSLLDAHLFQDLGWHR